MKTPLAHRFLSKKHIPTILSVLIILLVTIIILQINQLNSLANTYGAAVNDYANKLSNEKSESSLTRLADNPPTLEPHAFASLSSEYQKAKKLASAIDACTTYIKDLTIARKQPYAKKSQLYRANLQFTSQLGSAFSDKTKDDLRLIQGKNAPAAANSRIDLFNAYIDAAKLYKEKATSILSDKQTFYEKNYVDSIQNYITVHENEVKILQKDANKIFTNNRQQKMNVGLATSELQKNFSYINNDLGQYDNKPLSQLVANNSKNIIDQSKNQRSENLARAAAAIQVRAVVARALLPSSNSIEHNNETVYTARAISDDIDRITNEVRNKSDREQLMRKTREVRESISLYATNSQIYDGAYFAKLRQAAEFDQELYNSTGAPKLTDIFGADKKMQREIIEAQIKTQKKANERTAALSVPNYIKTEMETLIRAQRELVHSYEKLLSDIAAGKSANGRELSKDAIAADKALDPIAKKLDDIEALSRHTSAALTSIIDDDPR